MVKIDRCWIPSYREKFFGVGCVCILYIELMYIVVVEIFGFEISVVSKLIPFGFPLL